MTHRLKEMISDLRSRSFSLSNEWLYIWLMELAKTIHFPTSPISPWKFVGKLLRGVWLSMCLALSRSVSLPLTRYTSFVVAASTIMLLNECTILCCVFFIYFFAWFEWHILYKFTKYHAHYNSIWCSHASSHTQTEGERENQQLDAFNGAQCEKEEKTNENV